MEEHVQKHVKNLEFDCDMCENFFPSTPALRNHLSSKHPSIHRCEECPYETTLLSSLKEHLSVKHKNIMHKCSQCDFIATRDTYVRKHIRMKHMEENIEEKHDFEKIYLIEKVKDNIGSNLFNSPTTEPETRQVRQLQTAEPTTVKVKPLIDEEPQGSEMEEVEEKYADKEMTQITSCNEEVAESMADEEVEILGSTDHHSNGLCYRRDSIINVW